jgi:hypothetical protein
MTFCRGSVKNHWIGYKIRSPHLQGLALFDHLFAYVYILRVFIYSFAFISEALRWVEINGNMASADTSHVQCPPGEWMNAYMKGYSDSSSPLATSTLDGLICIKVSVCPPDSPLGYQFFENRFKPYPSFYPCLQAQAIDESRCLTNVCFLDCKYTHHIHTHKQTQWYMQTTLRGVQVSPPYHIERAGIPNITVAYNS